MGQGASLRKHGAPPRQIMQEFYAHCWFCPSGHWTGRDDVQNDLMRDNRALSPIAQFVIYPPSSNARRETATVASTELRVRNAVYQVFSERRHHRELFRVKVGRKEVLKLRNSGIIEEADFSGDGKNDYVGYGRDDRTEELLLFLSNEQYSRTDIFATTRAAWQRRWFHATPDFCDVRGEYRMARAVLERSSSGLILVVTVDAMRFSQDKKRTNTLCISPKNFVP